MLTGVIIGALIMLIGVLMGAAILKSFLKGGEDG